MSELRTKLVDIQTEKNTKLTPENLREGITCLGVTGILKEGIDTSDATATSGDIAYGKTAYVNGEKIEGTVPVKEAGQTQFLYKEYDTVSDIEIMEYDPTMTLDFQATVIDPALIKPSSKVRIGAYWGDVANAIGLTSDKIVTGNTVLGVKGTATVGINTNDATARGYDMAEGKTAYVGGIKIEGTLPVVNSQFAAEGDLQYKVFEYTDKGTGELLKDEYFSVRYYNTEKQIFSETSSINLTVQLEDVARAINLTANQIQAGSTILGINGTAPVTFATVEEMESNTNFAENTFAIVYGTAYVGTYKLDNGIWTQIGEATDNSEMMKILNETDGDILEYEGNGGTDEEINAVLEDILTNPNIEIEDIPEDSPLSLG